eukprot:4681754-Heterocapsa_arctica.AAC.1
MADRVLTEASRLEVRVIGSRGGPSERALRPHHVRHREGAHRRLRPGGREGEVHRKGESTDLRQE